MTLIVALRLVHVMSGALWVGMFFMTNFFVAPAIGAAGPEGGKVMMALQRRGLMTVMPVVGVLTLLSGFWLIWHFSAGFQPGYFRTSMGRAYSTGGGAAVLAYLVGISVMRPAMMRAAALAQTLGPAAPEVQRLRARGAVTGRVVLLLLLIATAAMAVGRYL